MAEALSDNGLSYVADDLAKSFGRLMTEKLDNGDTNTRKGYIRSIIDAVKVDDQAVRIIGSRDILQAVIAGKQNTNGGVRGFVRKWRTSAPANWIASRLYTHPPISNRN